MVDAKPGWENTTLEYITVTQTSAVLSFVGVVDGGGV